MTPNERTAAFYADAAAKLDDGHFGMLSRPPFHADDRPDVSAPATVRIQWAPGDGTVYDVLLSRVGDEEIAVSVIGGGCAVFAFDGLYLDAHYVQSKLLGARPLTGLAVAALIGRAHDAAAAFAPLYEEWRREPGRIFVIIDEG